MANTELWTVEKFINDTLKADIEIAASLVGVRVYSELIPPRIVSSEATYPCIVFQSMAPVDINGANTTRIAVSDIFAVKAIGKDSFASVDAIAARIDELLHGVKARTFRRCCIYIIRDTHGSDVAYFIAVDTGCPNL